MEYGVYSDASEEIEVLFEAFEGGDAADWSIGDTGSWILLMVPQTREPVCWLETCVPGVKVSCMGYFLLQSSPQAKPPSKRRYLG